MDLSEHFSTNWQIAVGGKTQARLARWRVAHWIIAQKLGLRCWAKAPLFFGRKMYVRLGETTSGSILAFRMSEVALTAFMLEYLRPGMTVIDVGAHLGYETLLAAEVVGPLGRVISFEPNSSIFPWLKRNTTTLPQVRLVQAAVGDRIGEIKFDQRPIELSGFSRVGKGEISVPMTTLDLSITERPVHFIKCDVEGFEINVVKGAANLLRADRPIVVLEADMIGDDPARKRAHEQAALMRDIGYEAFDFDFDGAFRIAPLGTLKPGHANVAYMPLKE
jgi:FkbM family methyltransferase